MKSSEFIVKELELFVKKFPKTRVRYEDDQLTVAHFIEIIPNEIYKFDENYIKWERDLFKRFISEYPYENICFISDNAIVGLDEVHFEKCGTEFIEFSVKDDSSVIFNQAQINVHLKNVNIGFSFPDSIEKEQKISYNSPTFEHSFTYQLAA